MSQLGIVFVALLAAAPQVEVSTLQGEQQVGELSQLTATALTIQADGRERQVPIAQVLEIRFTGTAQPVAPSPLRVDLVDGSHFGATSAATTAREMTFESPALGRITVPAEAVASIRFVSDEAAAKVETAWTELRGRDLKGDLLVIRKEDLLDHLEGTVGQIDDKLVKFLLEGDEIPVKRERVFGVIYARRKPAAVKPACEVSLAGGDLIKVRSLTAADGRIEAQLLAGAKLSLPFDAVRTLDFSLGKVRYLSQMEPRDVEYTPFFDVTWKYRRDKNLDGNPIQVGGKTYSRGLSIHSKTLLRYRIGSEYRRFQAVMGIDDELARRGLGDVKVVISGDGKPLWEGDVKGTDEPQPLDLDVTGVRDLEILVDFGGDLDIADHLDLADAKVLK